jgi:hypothetical protein
VASPIVNDQSGKGKDKLAYWLRRTARELDAIGYAWCTEAWILTNVDIRPRGSWEHVPGREEVLAVFGEHVALEHAVSWRAVIRRPHKRKPTIDPWTGGEVSSFTGRFVGVIPSRQERENAARALEKLADSGASLTPEERRYHIDRALERMRGLGISEHVLEHGSRLLEAQLAERGHEVAPRKDDQPLAEPANDGALHVVNLDDEVPT